MSIEATGFDDLSNYFSNLEENAKELDGTRSVPLDDLLDSKFLRKHSSFSSFDELLKAGNFKADTQEEFESIPDEEFDKHIASCTDFSFWEEMLEEAGSEYALRQLGLN